MEIKYACVITESNPRYGGITEIPDYVIKQIRADAIDEFVERITLPLTEEDIERIVKELKE